MQFNHFGDLGIIKKIKVLFVCMGNICRSPTADAVFRHHVKSAGVDHLIRVRFCRNARVPHRQPAGSTRATYRVEAWLQNARFARDERWNPAILTNSTIFWRWTKRICNFTAATQPAPAPVTARFIYSCNIAKAPRRYRSARPLFRRSSRFRTGIGYG
jgi:hypothetical protein